MNQELLQYIENEIIPQYASFDAAHREDHARAVIALALDMAALYPVDEDMVLAAAACHDIGLREGRDTHHIASARMIREDKMLPRWFTKEQIDVIADAAEDHRASSGHEPRTIYGRIVAEADRLIDGHVIMRRTIQYGLAHEPQFGKEGQWRRTLGHLKEKYADGGYLRLWIPESPNAGRLAEFRAILRDEVATRRLFDEEWGKLGLD